jgi:hypothetical protein
MIAVRNGIIIRDILFDSENTARDAYADMISMPDWGAMFAPGSWGISRTLEQNIKTVISGSTRATLKPISHFKTDLMAILLMVAFILGLVYFFRAPILQIISGTPNVSTINPTLAEEYKKQIERKKAELDKQFDIPEKTDDADDQILIPYDYLPEPAARARLCQKATAFIMQPISGWQQTNAICDEVYTNATLRRTNGTLAEFYDQANALMPGAYVIENSDSEIFIRVKLPELDAVSSIDERDANTVARAINTLFQGMNAPVKISITSDQIGDGANSINLSVLEVGAESKLVPTEFMKIFADIQGVYLTRSQWVARSKTWNYEVIVYVK